MNKILVWCLLLGMSVYAHAQVVTITDKETNDPLDQVVLMNDSLHAFATTNAKGQADITAFKGAEAITIQLLGYQTVLASYAELSAGSYQLSPTAMSTDVVVISATRWSQPSSDVPTMVATITQREVYLQNPQTAADLLAASGKVFIQKSQQGGGSPMIRGFATNRLLYTVDGVRMNTAIFRGGNIQNVISLDPFAMERTEVIFGASSVIYGSDAIGAVMAFETLVPELSVSDKPLITGKALTRYASANNELTGHFDVNVGWKKWSMVSSLSYNRFGDLRMGGKGPDEYLRPFYVQRIDSTDVVVTNDEPKVQRPTAYSQINMMQKLRFKPNEKWDIRYGFHYSETSNYARYDRHIRYKNGLPRYGEWYYGPQKWMMNNLNLTQTGYNTLYDQLVIRLAHQLFEESRISRDFNKPDCETRTEQVQAWSANLDLIKSIGTRNKLFYGLEFVLNDVTSTGVDENIDTGTSMPGPSRYPQATWASYAAYITDQFKLNEQFLLQAGLRYNYFTLQADFDTSFYPFPFTTAELNKGSLTGSFGLVYRPTNKWVISANFATAFRSPNVDDIGKVFDSEPGAVVVPNPDLQAEYAYNFDLGIAKVFGEVMKIEVSGFYTILQNALVRRDFSLNGLDSIMYDGTLSQVQAIQNAAVAHVYGFHAGLEIKLPAGFGISSDLNYQHGEEELDDGTKSPSRHAAPMFGVTRLTYKANKLNLQLYAEYSAGKTYDQLPEEEKSKTYLYALHSNGNPYSPRWYTLNFKAMYSITEHFSVSAGIENITDIRYRPYSSGIVAPGRNFILALRANF